MTGAGLERKLTVVAGRLVRLRKLRCLTRLWLWSLLPVAALILFLPPQLGGFRTEILLLPFVAIAGSIAASGLARIPSLTDVARVIEQREHDLDDAVITAAELLQNRGTSAGVLEQMAVEDAERLVAQRDLSQLVPGRQLLSWTALSLLSFSLLISGAMAAGRYGRDLLQNKGIQNSGDPQAVLGSPTELRVVVEPGDTEIEQGSALTVVARFSGAIPEQVVLEFEQAAEPEPRQMEMLETVDEGVFAVRMEQIAGDGTYRVRFLDRGSAQEQSSERYQVRTYVRPALLQIDADLQPPEWSGLPKETIEDVVRVTVTEGTTIGFRMRLNKAVAIAELRPAEGPAIELVPLAVDPATVAVELTMRESARWTIYLRDAEGREPVNEDRLSVTVLRNQAAIVKPVFPTTDTNVSALQEFLVEGTANDDFGLIDYGIEYSLSGGELQEISLRELSSESGTSEQTTDASIRFEIDLEALGAAPDDLLTWSFWAVDQDADGAVRRSTSDLMFAEVRRFEEIFREAQQPGGQQQGQQGGQQGDQQGGQQGGAAENLLRLQKEITTATWNVARSVAERKSSGTLADDVQTILDSQQEALQQLQEPAEDDPAAAATAELRARAAEEMSAVLETLASALEADTETKLGDALPQEQKVIRTLLQMRAAEARVQEQQQQQGGGGGGGGGGSSAARQQMQQLELDNDRNRYESERQARQQESNQQREELQVLNRLRELAQRQQMLNERLKQLESELRAAESDAERDEIERELKRLRDEQRDMLRDVDELNERMQQQSESQQAQQTQQEPFREQLQDARENLQEASRAMDEGRLADAIAEGTRAERRIDDLKEDFRNQTSSRFEDAMRDLRQQARQLNEDQQELARQLAGNEQGEQQAQRPSLRSTQDREGVEEAIQQQRDRLQEVLEESRELVEQAETSEPLLSERLYDTLREVRDLKPEEALEAAEMLAGRGLWPQTQEAEQIARRGLERLQAGIEDAADAVLGGEAESLRRAQEELRDATQQLSEEVRDASGEQSENGSGGNESAEGRQEGDSQQPEGQGSGRNPGEGEPGEQNQQRGADGQRSASDSERPEGEQPPSPGGDQGGQRPSEQEGEQPGQGQSQQEGGQPGQGQPGQGQSEQEGGQSGQGQPSQQNQNGSQRGQNGERSENATNNQNPQNGGNQSVLMGGGRESRDGSPDLNAPGRPLTGNDFSNWSDQLRDIEEMLDDPELRSRIARVRDRARAIRAEFRRHGTEPQWDLVRSQLLNEMQQLQQQIDNELRRLESDRAMVPIDREPVPEEFDSLVQRYYELLGQQRQQDESPEAATDR